MSFDRIRSAVLAQTAVVTGVATVIAALVQKVRDEADALAASGADITALNELASEIEANTASLSQAAAVNTDASDEVHADDGGTGDHETAVEPAPAPVEAPAEAPADGAAQAGAGDDLGGEG